MDVIISFLTDAAKIVFASAVVGFFIPAFGASVTNTMFTGGAIMTIFLLTVAVGLSKLKKSKI
jgi:hypothetical protein